MFSVVFCGVMLFIIVACMVVHDIEREYELERKERFELENNIHKEQLKRIKNYISNKLLKSWEVEMGLNSSRSDRLMTETVTELQIIESMIDEVMTWEDYE